MRKRWSLFTILFLVQMAVHAQVHIAAQTDKQQYLIGDYIRVQLTATGDSTFLYNWPLPQEIATFEYITSGPVDTVHGANGWELHQEIVYSVYDSGSYYFPRVALSYKNIKNNTSYQAYSDSLPFSVQSVAVDTTQAIRPIKDVMDVRVIDYTLLYYIGGFILLSLIGAAIYLIFFFRKKKVKPVAVVTPLSLYESTMLRLKQLDDKKLWQQDALKEYYSELTDIIRYYLEHRFGVHAMESTSDEILAQLYALPLAMQFQESIKFILYTADMAKFAKSKPLPDENMQAMQHAVAFVLATKPEAPKKEVES